MPLRTGGRNYRAMRCDVVTVGETMGLLTPRSGGGYARSHAGGESNVAVNLARLGHRTRWVSRLGSDEMGDFIESALRDEGVEVVAERDPKRVTGLMLKEFRPTGTAVRYYRADSAASSLSPPSDDSHLGDADWLHITGVTPALSPSCREATLGYMVRARARGMRVSFDVNYRRALWSDVRTASRVLLDLCRRADTVFVGDDEARDLWDVGDPDRFAAFAGLSQDTEVVFKRGAEGAEHFARGQRCFEPAQRVETIVDVTGAGDAFAAGYLAGALRGADLPAALRLGHLLAAAAIQVADDIGPTPSEESVSDLVGTNRDARA